MLNLENISGEKDSPDDYFKTTNCPSFVAQTSSPGALSDVTNDMNLVNPGEKIYQTYTPKCTFGQVLAHSTPISSNNNNQVGTVNCISCAYRKPVLRMGIRKMAAP